jgi:LAS superfamily LD-carboxypeptidase LdcB
MRWNVFLLLIFLACQDKPKPETMTAPPPSPYEPKYTVDFLMGKFDPATHEEFTLIQEGFADREGRYMHREAYVGFLEMFEAAQEQGINLQIISAARNFDYQKGIWERKWRGNTLLEGKTDARIIEDPSERALAILRYSAMPGASRHHWGTDIDLNALDNGYFSSGEGKKTFDWLEANARNFGFCRPYTAKDGKGRSTGYEEEKWHWSYYPLSKVMTKDASILLQDSLIIGFAGSETATDIQVVDHFILGVDKSCL